MLQVRDAEPSSIIAYTLCTKDYQHYLELDTQTASFEDNVDKSSKTAKKQLTAPSSAQLKNVSTELIKENQVFGKDELDGSFKIGFRGSRNSKQLGQLKFCFHYLLTEKEWLYSRIRMQLENTIFKLSSRITYRFLIELLTTK